MYIKCVYVDLNLNLEGTQHSQCQSQLDFDIDLIVFFVAQMISSWILTTKDELWSKWDSYVRTLLGCSSARYYRRDDRYRMAFRARSTTALLRASGALIVQALKP